MRFGLFFYILVFPIIGSAQNYFYIRTDGVLPKGYVLDKIYEQGKTVHLTQPSNDQLSAAAPIPFDFYFYGKLCNAYKVSDNGYITFDLAQTKSLKPDSILPESSIMGFWQDFILRPLPPPNEGIGVQVFSYTLGTAPNRTHVIQYYGLTLASDQLDHPVTNSTIYAFAIILHEGSAGRFDLVYSPYGDKERIGAAGCSDVADAKCKLLKDTLVKLPVQFSFDLDKFIVYRFNYGKQPNYDLVINQLDLGKIYPVNSIVNLSGKMSNWGQKRVSSFYMNYSINGGDTISYQLDNLTLQPNGEGTMNFTHPISWLSGAAGSLSDINFWLSQPDGMPDSISANSNVTRTVLRNNNNGSIQRNVLFEEATGAWCGYCPDAHLVLKQAVKQYGKRIVPVSYHSEDSMTNTDGQAILSAYVTGYPDALLDRKVFLGSNSTWLGEVNARLNVKTPVAIFIEEKNFNVQTREITYKVRAKFSDYWYGNLRLGSIVTENNVRGNDYPNIWSQFNYYSKQHAGGVAGPSHPLYNEKEYMDGYVHQFVCKAMPGSPWGVEGLIPILVAPNAEYSFDFTYVLPPPTFVSYAGDNNTEYCNTIDIPGQNEGWNIPANINLVGYVAEYNDTDVLNRPVINAGQKRLWDLDNAIAVKQLDQLQYNVFPNPANHTAYIGLKLQQPSNAAIVVTNQLGQVVLDEFYPGLSSGDNMMFIHTADLAPGVYYVHLQTTDGDSVSKLSILHP